MIGKKEKHMTISRKLLFITAFALGISGYTFYYVTYQKPHKLINLKIATKEFEQSLDQAAYDARKTAIATYYTSGQYETEIAQITQEALQHFSTIPVIANSAI